MCRNTEVDAARFLGAKMKKNAAVDIVSNSHGIICIYIYVFIYFWLSF